MNRDKAAPLIRSDLPEFERALPAVWPDRTGADAGIVDENIDAAEPIARGFGDLLGRGVAGQIGLDGEQIVRLICSRGLAASASKGSRSRSTPATRMPAANSPRVTALPIPPAAPVTIATLRVSAIAGSSLLTRAYLISDFKEGR
jgi:hypothetical protein